MKQLIFFCFRSQQRRSLVARYGLTLVEMLVAMAIALLMMAAVVTVFANISASTSNRRATIEMSGQLRSVAEQLSRDLEGATCPAIPWQKPDAAQGYIELIEGVYNDAMPSPWLWDSPDTDNGAPDTIGGGTDPPSLDLGLSFLPGSNLRDSTIPVDEEGRGVSLGNNEILDEEFKTDGRGLGDGDDVLMLTTRNEVDQFVGRIPSRSGNTPANSRFPDWENETIESPLAEVIWYSVENPPERVTTFAFGEPGFRTIYRRALIIAPWLDYQIRVNAGGRQVTTGPSVVRVLIDRIGINNVDQALACLISFQEIYDLSVRLEWDPLMPSSDGEGRWVLKANSLADLTKRENRYAHHGFHFEGGNFVRRYPFAAISNGTGYSNDNVIFVFDPELTGYRNTVLNATQDAQFALVDDNGDGAIDVYEPNPSDTFNDITDTNRRYPVRPFVYVANGGLQATPRALLNADGNVVHVRNGLVPLSGSRQGEDIMMTDALAFDLKVYDPGAPLYGYYPSGFSRGLGDDQDPALYITIPGEIAWNVAFNEDRTDGEIGNLEPDTNNPAFAWERNGTYVDLGYGRSFFVDNNQNLLSDGRIEFRFLPQQFYLGAFKYAPGAVVDPSESALYPNVPDVIAIEPSYFTDGQLRATDGTLLSTGVAVYDTWSWHYENNGLDEDNDGIIDQVTNGFDDNDFAGVDDASERETRPPYDRALRGLQVKLRVYERDSRQIRETTVRESFVPE